LKSAVYRCDQAHRTLVAWLRKFGIDDPKPCHRLRKEFGSFVSTTLGLFHAQRFLGHSSPNVTSDYYAGLTDLPQLKAMPERKPDSEKGKKSKSRKNAREQE
jgi:integrase